MEPIRSAQLRDERGANAVEYGLLVAMIAAVIVVAVLGLGTVVHDHFSTTCDTYQTSTQQSGSDCDN